MNTINHTKVGPEFLAGLIVGEGTFCLSMARSCRKNGKRSYYSYRVEPTFRLPMDDHETIEIAAQILRDNGVKVGKLYKVNGRKALTIAFGGGIQVKKIIEIIFPYLTGTKKEAAAIVYEFILSREKSRLARYNAPYTEYQISLIEKLRMTNGNQNRPRTSTTVLNQSFAQRSDLVGHTSKKPQ